ncbi:MAG: hypothetical protein Q9165_001046 [Trypethelium subeluteriae]
MSGTRPIYFPQGTFVQVPKRRAIGMIQCKQYSPTPQVENFARGEELKGKAEPGDVELGEMLCAKARVMGDVIKSTNVLREELEQENSLHKASVTRLHDENEDLRRQSSSLRQDLKDRQESNKQLNETQKRLRTGIEEIRAENKHSDPAIVEAREEALLNRAG